MQLFGGGARGQREIQAVDEPASVHGREAQERSLGLARPGFGLDDDEPFVQRSPPGRLLLDRVRTRRALDAKQLSEAGETWRRLSPVWDVKAERTDRISRPLTRGRVVVRSGFVHVREELLVGTDPVGQVAQAHEHVLELGR